MSLCSQKPEELYAVQIFTAEDLRNEDTTVNCAWPVCTAIIK